MSHDNVRYFDALVRVFERAVRTANFSTGCFMEIDEEKVDEAVLALLYLTTFKDKPR